MSAPAIRTRLDGLTRYHSFPVRFRVYFTRLGSENGGSCYKCGIQRRWNARDELGIQTQQGKQCLHRLAGALFNLLAAEYWLPIGAYKMDLAASLSHVTMHDVIGQEADVKSPQNRLYYGCENIKCANMYII